MRNTYITIGCFSALLATSVAIFQGKNVKHFYSNERNAGRIKGKSEIKIKNSKIETQRRLVNYQNSSSAKFHNGSDFEKTVAFKQLASNDISEALLVAASENDIKKRSEYYGIIACVWAKTDPDGCYKWTESLESPWDKQSALVNLLQTTASTDGAKKALDLFDRIPKGNIKDAALVFAFMYIAASDTEGAIKRAEDLSGRSAANAISKLLSEKLASDSNTSKIFDTWYNIKPGEFRDLFGSAMYDALSKKSPDLAKDWLESISHDMLTNDGFDFLERQAAIKNANSGLAISPNEKSTTGRDSDQSKYGHEWGLKEPASAKKWLLEITSSGDYNKNSDMANAVVEELIRWDQEEILKNISKIEDRQTKSNLMNIAAKELILVNPARGMELIFASENPNTDNNRHTVSKAMSLWMNKDPIAASKWIGLQNSGPLKDVAIKSLVENSLIREKNHDLAIAWTDSISDGQLRDTVIKQIHEARNKK